VGLATEGRQPPREGSTVLAGGHLVGSVTSGNFSPMLEHGIALALVDSTVGAEPGDSLDLEQRGKVRTATVVTTPFVRSGQFALPA
jgi:aminomethyltransferase